jgi:predicted PolB exonuclease-like 3'-5' exonuclease
VIAERRPDGWIVRSVGAPCIAQRSEAEIIDAFVRKVDELHPTLVSYNGHGFDLPVLRYRAMVNFVHAPGLSASYFNRYTEEAIDFCDVLSNLDMRGKMSLDALCKGSGSAGKAGRSGWR